jgi:hypothetical protein
MEDRQAMRESQTLAFSVVGEYLNPETLAMIGRSTKKFRTAITPVLERKKRYSDEMRKLLFRLFPSITNVPKKAILSNEEGAAFYLRLIESYFAPQNTSGLFIEIGVRLRLRTLARENHDNRHGKQINGQPMLRSLDYVMESAHGRRMVLKYIEQLQVELHKEHCSFLEYLAFLVRSDFTVRYDLITYNN